MSLKGLFGKDKKTTNISSLVSFERALDDVESIGYIEQFIKDRKRYKTHTDYLTASNFCAYGSLEEYYRSGVDRVINTYPYDGSLKEKIQWFNDSSGFDLHLFENEYPRTNGYIQLGSGNWGDVSSTSGSYGNPQTKEYIFIKGGPNVGNVYSTASHQTSNLEINGRSGNTVEFWLKKGSYETSKTSREVVFDNIASGSYESATNAQYGRLTIELDNTDNTKSPFLLTYRSGSDGFAQQRVGATHLYASASDDSWHHYAFSFKNVDSKIRVNTFVDGVLNDTKMLGTAIGARNNAMVASIGSLVAAYDAAATSADAPGEGHGKLSGYLDEFRYWKKERTAKDISRFWFTQVGAGSNTDTANSSLGFYYKFNEGETGKTNIDKRILDYSGRVSNGVWVGYPGSGRYNNSAMVEASASLSEFKDPILYIEHPTVSSFRQDALERGYAYDLENASSMYYSYPNWIVDEDGDGSEDLKKITQVVASYFDSLFLQIKDLGELRHLKYHDFNDKPYPFNNIKLESLGLVTPELFMDASNLNILANRDEDKHFKQDTADVKNFIYNNIYNNLESIFKSKGTEKSFRNLFRCFGIDNELIKINLYSTDSTYPIESSYGPSSVKTKYVNFADSINKRASVFQSLDGLEGEYRLSDARGFLKGTNNAVTDDDAIEIGMTTEAQVFLPRLYPLNHPFHFPTEVSSSVFGCHRVVDESDDENLNWQSTAADDHSFQVYVAKEKLGSRTGRFVLKTRSGLFDAVESPNIVDLYDSNRWNLAVRLANSSGAPISGSSYEMQFYGVSTVSDAVDQSFYVKETISEANAKNFMKYSKRFYVGSENENFTGDPHYNSDVKVSNFRVWMDTLTNEEIDAHAIDPRSYGLSSPSAHVNPLQELGDAPTKRIDLLAINWDFSNLTGSNSNGDMWITDVSSGSLEDEGSYGKLAPITRRLHPGKGINFAPATTSSVDVEYDQAARLQTFENVKATDMVKILSNDDITFTRETKPTDFFFSFEKSMYAAISDEMLNFFGGINDFSNLIGAPVERYRPNYKAMSKLRQTFFSRVENTPDVERYVEYYKWLDSSLSVMIDQLVPASVAASEDIRNVIESHILERSKYFNKFPTMDLKKSEPLGQIRGVNELLYDWQHGHAPIGKGPDVNCLWTKERAQRRTDLHVTSSGDTDTVLTVDQDREVIRRISVTSVSGSTYATRRLSRPYRLSVEDQRHLKGGDNSFGNKKKRLFTGISTAHGKSHIAITGSEASSEACKDPIHPSRKKKIRATADIGFTNKDRDVNDIAPFTLYSSSLDPISGYQTELHDNFKKGVDITNLHSDEYGDDREVTLQSPFTERWVGGNQHRHQDLSGSLLAYKHNDQNRLEAFKLLAKGEKLYVLPPNASGLTVGNVPIIDPSIQGAQMLREDLAKRPVNIRNIRTTTGSISLGNFNHPYDVVQYTSEDQRKDFLVDNDQPLTPVNSITTPGVQETTKYARPARKHVFNARFSAPGGPEVWGDSLGGEFLDRATNQYSVYNSLNYRNLTVRDPLNTLSSIPQTASTDSNSLVTNHRVNANPRRRHRLAEDIDLSSGQLDLNQDNVFVRHPIPQNDTQYSWITASLNHVSPTSATKFGGRNTSVNTDTWISFGDITDHKFCNSGNNQDFSYAISFWVRVEDQSTSFSDPEHHLFGRYRTANGTLRQEYVGYLWSGNLYVQHKDDDGGKHTFNTTGKQFGYVGNVSPYSREWFHVVINYNASTVANSSVMSFYINGKLANSETENTAGYVSMHRLLSTELIIGGFDRQDNLGLQGSMFDFVIFNFKDQSDGLTAAEVAELYNDGKRFNVRKHSRFDKVVSWYKLGGERDTSESFKDYSGNGYDSVAVSENNPSILSQAAAGPGGDDNSQEFGHLHSFTQAALGESHGSVKNERTYNFLNLNDETNIDVDFVGLNTNIRDDIDVVTNTVTAQDTRHISGTIHHRQGPYGWPSWKQIRAGDSALGRYFRKNNLYSIPVLDRGNGNVQLQFPTLGNYSWPNNVEHRTAAVGRTVGNTNYRFTDPAVSSNNKPIVLKGTTNLTARFFASSAVITGVPRRSNTNIPGVLVEFKKTYSFANNVSKFANDKLSKVLGIVPTREEESKTLRTDELLSHDFTRPGAVAEYSTNIFPKEENTYLERSRSRSQYTANEFWRDKRAERTQTDSRNSQGFEVSKLSVWPMDGPEDFRTSAIKKTTDTLGNDGSGELLANYSTFHNNLAEPVPSALFARPFPLQATSSIPDLPPNSKRMTGVLYPPTLAQESTPYSSLQQYRLSYTITRKAQFFSDLTLNPTHRMDGTDLQPFGAYAEALKATAPNCNAAVQDGVTVYNSNRVPMGFTNERGETISDGVAQGSRLYNPHGVSNTPMTDYLMPLALSGVPQIDTSNDLYGSNSPPAGFSYYLALSTTGSSIIGSRGGLISFHAYTKPAFSTGDLWSAETGNPLYVQLGAGTSWQTIATISSTEISEVNKFKHFSFAVPSTTTHHRIRFATGVSNPAATLNRTYWYVLAPSIYKGRFFYADGFDMEYTADLKTNQLGFDDASREPTSAFLTAEKLPSKKVFYSPQTTGRSNFISAGQLENYGDEVNDVIPKSSISSQDLHTFDRLYRQNSNLATTYVSMYAKNEKLDHHLFGSQFFRTPEHANRNPFNFENYKDFKEQARLLAKDYALVPEFRISEHMDYYINTIGGEDPFFSCNDTFLDISGSSADLPLNSAVDNFYEVYSHSDFLKHFSVVEEDFREVKTAKPTKLKLECRAFKKFLPYKGLYPADRMTQLAGEFSSSYSQYITGGHFRNALAPYYAPGIGFNTIKSGIAVDYPVIEPEEDRIYNQYGVIFQSASLAIDHGGNAVKTDALRGDFPYISGMNGSGVSRAYMSNNRIEIGGGSDWAKVLTGSLAPGGEGVTDKYLTISLWMYFPKYHSENKPLSSFGALKHRGCIATFNNLIRTPAANESAVRTTYSYQGINFGYWIQAAGNETVGVGTGGPDGSTDIVDKTYTIGFVCFGGNYVDADGTGNVFQIAKFPTHSKTPQGSYTGDDIALSPGWNHIMLSLKLDGIGNSAGSSTSTSTFTGFDAYLNGVKYRYTGHINASGDFYPSTGDAGNVNNLEFPSLDGQRNCFIGAHHGFVKQFNETDGGTNYGSLTARYTDLDPNTYTHGNHANSKINDLNAITFDGSLDASEISSYRRLAAAGSSIADINGLFLQDFLYPGENMMSDIVIFNSFDESWPKKMSGYVDTTPNFREMTRVGETDTSRSEQLTVFSTVGDTMGARNPYTILSKEHSSRIVAWYRPGNDSGYLTNDDGSSAINGQPVFNHAQNLFSGKTINLTTGSVQAFDEHLEPLKYNFLSGTFYGFTEWTGSVSEDLKWSDRKRQRWNGIVDISNPAQYTMRYMGAEFAETTYVNSMPFKTWYSHIGDTTWFNNANDYNEKALFDANTANLSSSYATCTGSIRVPSFIVGQKHNFTEDSMIPRIGSASYGTYNFIGNGPLKDDQVGSRGWLTDYQETTGIRKVSRVPFEAIIKPEIYTPEMKDGGDLPLAQFFDVEPHASASLLGAFTTSRRYVGQNDHGQQTFNWTSTDYQSKYKTDENFHFGVPMNSSSLMTEFDLAAARSSEDKNVYTLAASNFYAEAINFFIDNKKGVTIRSLDTPRFIPEIGKTYQMSIDLNSGFSGFLGVKADNPMYNNPAAFGLPFDAGRLRKQHPDGTYFNRISDINGYGFAPYLPPHYDGQSRAVFTFTPSEGPSYATIEEILKDTTVSYIRNISATGSIREEATGRTSNEDQASNSVVPSYNRRFAMHMSASFNGLSFENMNLVQSYDTDGNVLADRKSLVVQSKFECPTFDFTKVDADQPRTSKTLQHLPKIKGIWHQTGSYNSFSRPFVAVTSPRSIEGVDDLAALLGMRVENGYNRIGEMPDELKIYEGVVAVPFRTINGTRKFYNLPPQEVYQAVRDLGYPDYKLQTEEDRRRFREYANAIDGANAGRTGGRIPGGRGRRALGDAPTTIDVRPPVAKMVESMMRYNIPPQFNFLKYNDQNGRYIRPFAMYVFDFSVTLPKEDIARIWQNVTPDFGLDNFGSRNGSRSVISSQIVEHDLFNVDDLLDPSAEVLTEQIPGVAGTTTGYRVGEWRGGLTKDTQWMVFKVKQKASADYFRKKELDRLPDGHPEKILSVENDIFKYGFNWPYDYFSIVELVNLNASVSFASKSEVIDEETARILNSRRDNE